MKQRITVLLMVCAAMIVSSPSTVRTEVEFSASIQINSPSDFYQPLEPYGSWVDVRSYGRCWHPGKSKRTGSRILSVTGNGPMGAGIGSVMNRGDGPASITGRAMMIRPSVGYGFPGQIGLRRG